MKKTIYELAKELNYAPSTISKALNNNPGISEDKRQMIIEYARKVGYVPNQNARTLKAKVSNTIGVLFSEELDIGLEHPFFSAVLQSFKKTIESKGFEMTFIVSKIGDVKTNYLDYCRNRNISGVLIAAGKSSDKFLDDIIQSELKVVSTDYVTDDVLTVISDNNNGVREAFAYANEIGTKSVGLLMGPYSAYSFTERFTSFFKYQQKYNFEYRDEWYTQSESYDFESGYTAMKKMIERCEKLPDVIFAVSDLLAMGAIVALEDAKIKVPEQISVFGFDDIEYAKYYKPSISTVRQNTKAIGETAANLLIDMLQNGTEYKEKMVRIPTKFIKRDSMK